MSWLLTGEVAATGDDDNQPTPLTPVSRKPDGRVEGRSE